ncbi:MAG: LysR substrate-binding domain-containing protein [Pseudomonadota bacterium]
MNRRRLNLNALRAFECAARQGSFSRAAEELCVTHAAVSHHVKALEQQLGEQLFERRPNGVELTARGELLRDVVGAALDDMEAGVEAVHGRPEKDAVRITTTPSFAAAWLVPRLARFREQHSDCEVEIQPTLDDLDFERSRVDIGIRCGVPPWSGVEAELLMPIHLLPVCSPSLVEHHGMPSEPQDLLTFPLIHADIEQRPLGEEWALWFRNNQVATGTAVPGQSFRDPSLAMNAAVNGVGVAMGYRELLAAELASGRLIAPFELPVRHPYSYYLVFRKDGLMDPHNESFRQWIRAETERSS